ncbi:hypothetical protein GPNCGGLF_LOCUS1991 [Methylorubrum aminovorans]
MRDREVGLERDRPLQGRDGTGIVAQRDENRAEAAEIPRILGLAINRDAEQVEGLLVPALARGDGAREMRRVGMGVVEADDEVGQGLGRAEIARIVALLPACEGVVGEFLERGAAAVIHEAAAAELLHQGAHFADAIEHKERQRERQPVARLLGFRSQGGDEVRHRRSGPVRLAGQEAEFMVRPRVLRRGVEQALKVAAGLLEAPGHPVRDGLGQGALERVRRAGVLDRA